MHTATHPHHRSAARRAGGPLRAGLSLLLTVVQTDMSLETDASAAVDELLAPRADPEPGRLAGITAAHNSIRGALGLPSLTWSTTVAQFAQAWADKLQAQGCNMQHRPYNGPDAQKYGENISGNWGYMATAAQVVAGWAAEVQDYDAETNTCHGVCGHYTQIVWRNSKRLGCGMATCGDTEVWVCNYDPPGNITGERPY